jgi:hypothetical protein
VIDSESDVRLTSDALACTRLLFLMEVKLNEKIYWDCASDNYYRRKLRTDMVGEQIAITGCVRLYTTLNELEKS